MSEKTPPTAEQVDDTAIGYYAPGKYMCRCVHCGGTFQGDKRAHCCRGCAIRLAALAPAERASPSHLGPTCDAIGRKHHWQDFADGTRICLDCKYVVGRITAERAEAVPEWEVGASQSIAGMATEWYRGPARGDQDLPADLILSRLRRFIPTRTGALDAAGETAFLGWARGRIPSSLTDERLRAVIAKQWLEEFKASLAAGDGGAK